MSISVEIVQIRPVVLLVLKIMILSGIFLLPWGMSRLLRLSPVPIRKRYGAMTMIALGAFFLAAPGLLDLLKPTPPPRSAVSTGDGW